ncbi:MAG: hypothetical protein RB296_10750 [Acidobacteriota bacterium]|nr:hypothetical protein [Acidobacteriota bacterium]
MKPESSALPRRASPLLPVILITASGTLTLGGYEMVRSAAASIFLNHYSADRLPEALVLVPPAMFLLTWIFSVVLRRIGPGATYLSTLVLSGLVLTAATEAVRGRVPGAPYALYVFAQAYIVLIVEQVWAFINSRIRPGEGKRWNGPIIAASTLGSICGGLVTGKLSVGLGSERLVIIAAVLTAASSVLGWLAFHLPGPQPRPRKNEPARFSDHFAWDLLRNHPTIRRLAWMVMAQQAVSVLLDIAFHRALQQAMPLQDPRTAFLGYFWAAVNLFSLVLQLGVCPWLLSRTSLRNVHATVPLLYGSVALAAVFFPLLSILGAAFFLSKTVDYSVFRAAKEVLYIPLSFQARYRAKMTVDALIYRSTKGVVSAALSIAGRSVGFLPLRLYPLLAVIVCAGWNRSTRGLPEPAAHGAQGTDS